MPPIVDPAPKKAAAKGKNPGLLFSPLAAARAARDRRVSENSLPGPRARNRGSRRRVRLAKSQNAPGMRARVRRNRGGDFCHRWYDSGTGRYERPDPEPPVSATNLYRYAEANPLAYVDRNGLWPELIPTGWIPPQTGCLAAAGLNTLSTAAAGGGPRYAHCFASCAISKCAGPGAAIQLGALKESFDHFVCTYGRDVPYIGRKHCHSAYQPTDFEDNTRGLECPVNVPCEEQCGGLFGQEDSPVGGPFE